MVRPKKCRLVSSLPNITYFKPAGVPLRFLSEVCLSVEEGEALRLKDLENLEQIEGAQKMGVSRPTFQRILGSAHKKVADAILNGKAIKIDGGNFKLKEGQFECQRGHHWKERQAATSNGVCPFCQARRSDAGQPTSDDSKDSGETT